MDFVLKVALPDALFFDVDGVLIDSIAIKGEALAETFNDFPNKHPSIIDFHHAHGGVTRTKKISMLYRLLAGVDASRQEIQERSAAFAQAVRQRVIAADEIPGAEAALRMWAPRCPLYAVSATPHDELKFILVARGIRPYFSSIHGWPPAKDEVIAQLLAKHGYASKRCVLIGDSQEDLLASRRTGVRFVHVRGSAAIDLPGSHPTINDLHGLDSAITMTLASHPFSL